MHTRTPKTDDSEHDQPPRSHRPYYFLTSSSSSAQAAAPRSRCSHRFSIVSQTRTPRTPRGTGDKARTVPRAGTTQRKGERPAGTGLGMEMQMETPHTQTDVCVEGAPSSPTTCRLMMPGDSTGIQQVRQGSDGVLLRPLMRHVAHISVLIQALALGL